MTLLHGHLFKYWLWYLTSFYLWANSLAMPKLSFFIYEMKLCKLKKLCIITVGTVYSYHYYCDYSFQLFLLIVLLFLLPTSPPDSHQDSLIILNGSGTKGVLLNKTCK